MNQTQARVEALVYEKDGRRFIALGNYALDFKNEYLYLGMTATGNVILGDIVQSAFNGLHEIIKKRYGKIYNDKIHAEGCRYIEKLPLDYNFGKCELCCKETLVRIPVAGSGVNVAYYCITCIESRQLKILQEYIEKFNIKTETL